MHGAAGASAEELIRRAVAPMDPPLDDGIQAGERGCRAVIHRERRSHLHGRRAGGGNGRCDIVNGERREFFRALVGIIDRPHPNLIIARPSNSQREQLRGGERDGGPEGVVEQPVALQIPGNALNANARGVGDRRREGDVSALIGGNIVERNDRPGVDADALERVVYPVHVMTRKSFGLMTRKLSVTKSQRSAQFPEPFHAEN